MKSFCEAVFAATRVSVSRHSQGAIAFYSPTVFIAQLRRFAETPYPEPPKTRVVQGVVYCFPWHSMTHSSRFPEDVFIKYWYDEETRHLVICDLDWRTGLHNRYPSENPS